MVSINAIIAVGVLIVGGSLWGEVKREGEGEPAREETKVYLDPVLITSAGQSADVMIMRAIAQKAGIAFRLVPFATPDSLEGVRSVWLVAGGSSKGLGAAGIDRDKEEKRVKKLAEAVEKRKLPLIVFHIGGEARRGSLSDPFNRLAASKGERVIVVEGGDADSLFYHLAHHRNVPYTTVKKQADLIPLLSQLYGKEHPTPNSMR